MQAGRRGNRAGGRKNTMWGGIKTKQGQDLEAGAGAKIAGGDKRNSGETGAQEPTTFSSRIWNSTKYFRISAFLSHLAYGWLSPQQHVHLHSLLKASPHGRGQPSTASSYLNSSGSRGACCNSKDSNSTVPSWG